MPSSARNEPNADTQTPKTTNNFFTNTILNIIKIEFMLFAGSSDEFSTEEFFSKKTFTKITKMQIFRKKPK